MLFYGLHILNKCKNSIFADVKKNKLPCGNGEKCRMEEMVCLKFGIMYPDHLLNWLDFDNFLPLNIIFAWNGAIMVILTLVLRMHESNEWPEYFGEGGKVICLDYL